MSGSLIRTGSRSARKRWILTRLHFPGYQEVEIDVDMEVNALYYIIVQGDQSEIQVMSVPAAMTDMPFLGELYYQDASMDGMSLVADYDYGMPLRKMGMLVCGAAIIIVAALLLLLVKGIYRNPGR